MDAIHDDHLDLDNRREELNATLQSLSPPSTASSLSSFNKSLLFQHKTTSYQIKTNVQTLLLRNNQLTTLEPYAHTLRTMGHSLKELTLRSNAFIEFPKELRVLTQLTSLSIAKNQLSRIEINVFPSLSNLTWLSLSHNHLDALPSDLVACQHLLGLDLSNNNFYDLPPIIAQLSELQVLLIQKNHLTDLPIHSFPSSLQTLNLAFNEFQSMPKVLVTHPPPALTHLHLSGNPLRQLPDTFLQHGYRNLVSLDLHTCELQDIPPILFTRPIPLRRLNLAINHLSQLPSTIGLLTQLQWLNLNDNRLVTLPSTMSKLIHLVKLGLVQNQLEWLPPLIFTHMTCLEKIDLRRNQLVYLPPSILALAPENEVDQHIDLAVPVAVFQPHHSGGSLKTLLLYENNHLEQLDGIFARDGDQGTMQLSGLSETNDANALYTASSLKEIALRHYLGRTAVIEDEETQARFFHRAFCQWIPRLLVNTLAEQCDQCGQWTFVLKYQVGYLARLCNNRSQVPVRATVCSWSCAVDMVARIRHAADQWRSSSDKSVPPKDPDRFLSRVIHRVATSLAHCVAAEPVRLSDPRPALTAFHHLPRDAIRLERF